MVDRSGQLRGIAITMGVIGLLMIGAGVGVALASDSGLQEPTAGLMLRVGAVLAALAMVVPTLRRPSIPTMAVAGGGLLLVLARPGLVWAALLGWVLWLFVSRQRRTSSNDS